MNIFLYDHTFEGLLSAIFYAYDAKIIPDKIIGQEQYQEHLFTKKISIHTNPGHAKRVWQGIEKKLSEKIGKKIYRVFLSEITDIEMLIYKYLKLCFANSADKDTDYSNQTILAFNNIYKKVCREGHRAIMFIRFQKTADGIYYAPFEPMYNVLPLTIHHFKDRFSDQKWMIYDTRRNYGFFYDQNEVNEITISNSCVNPFSGKVNKEVLHENELNFQELWNDYFQSTNIKERKNLKLHKQFLPKKFWKYLPEKNFQV